MSFDTAEVQQMFGESLEEEGFGSPKAKEDTPHLNPRSCVTCRKRKVRCDKVEPSCRNCAKAGIDCVFPAPGRAPRRPRKPQPQDAELLKRLRRLESVVQNLGTQVEDGEPQTQSPPPQQSSRNSSVTQNSCPVDGKIQGSEAEEIPLGKLVISGGKSRYVNNSYWATIGNEISDIRDILDQSESEDELHIQESHDWESPGRRGFLFGFSSEMVDMQKFFPTPSQIFIIWEIFKENVDPIVKILHCPSARNLILKAAVRTDNLPRPAEALFFAICFASVVSMSEDQCQSLLGDSKMNLWKRYRFALEQALARADFLNSSSLLVLQAFIFYLVCLRFYDDTKSVWAMGGLAIQLSYTQGLHRDGTHFNLDPFQTEMRRRLWWHMSILDVRAAEDHGAELRTSQSDTKFPTNVNDEDIWPGMETPPVARQGPTEMTMCLIRFELSAMTRRLNLYSPDACLMSEEAIKAKEKMIDECHTQLEERYVKDCDMSIPIFWVAATVSRLILAKMWLKLHHPRLAGNGLYQHPDVRDRVFTTSVEVIEFGHLLESNENTAKWGWLFRTFTQWHALAYVISELCVRPPSSEVDRAWRAVESVYEESEHSKKQRGMLWKPIRQLMVKARAHQEQTRKAAREVNNEVLVAEQNPWMTGNNSVITSTAAALGLDLNDVAMLDELQGNADAMGLVFGETGLMNGLPNIETTKSPPESQHTQGSSPDFLNWEGWSPGVGGFSVGVPPSQPFGFDQTMPQEWF